MLKELLNIFKSDNPLRAMADDFSQMLDLAHDLTVRAGNAFFDEPATPEELTAIYKQDIKINKLERKIRKRVIAHLTIRSNTPDLPYCLLLMSLVKDAERIGDYAKNLSELRDIHPAALPSDDILAEVREIRAGVDKMLEKTPGAFSGSDRETAIELVNQGKDLSHRCDNLVPKIARTDYDAATTVVAVLATRFYKRINGHVLNLLSGVVMPLHKLDYYDEKEMANLGSDASDKR